MIWQDVVLTAGSLVLTAAVVPMIFAHETPPYKTSIPTASSLAVLSFVYCTLGLFLSAFITAGSAVGWSILAIQRLRG